MSLHFRAGLPMTDMLIAIQLPHPPVAAGQSGNCSSSTFLLSKAEKVSYNSASQNGLQLSLLKTKPRSSKMCPSSCCQGGHACAISSNTKVKIFNSKLPRRSQLNSRLYRHQSRLPPLCLPLLHRRLLIDRQRAHHP